MGDGLIEHRFIQYRSRALNATVIYVLQDKFNNKSLIIKAESILANQTCSLFIVSVKTKKKGKIWVKFFLAQKWSFFLFSFRAI
jgi:hypothetical protein